MQLFLLLGGITVIAIGGGVFLDILEHVVSRKGPGKKPGLQPQPPKPSSWEGSAEQRMLHTASEIRSWSSDRPY